MTAGTRAQTRAAHAAVRSSLGELEALLERADAALPPRSRYRRCLARIEGDLIDLAADLAPPVRSERRQDARLERNRVEWLAATCDTVRRDLSPLDGLVLRHASEAATALARGRAASRRARRRAVILSRLEPVNPQALAYLERLSDLLLVLSRAVDVDTAEHGSSRPAPVVRHACDAVPA